MNRQQRIAHRNNKLSYKAKANKPSINFETFLANIFNTNLSVYHAKITKLLEANTNEIKTNQSHHF